MSYCRWGKDSQFYVYLSESGHGQDVIVIQGEAPEGDDLVFKSRGIAGAYLAEQKYIHGRALPQHVLRTLFFEQDCIDKRKEPSGDAGWSDWGALIEEELDRLCVVDEQKQIILDLLRSLRLTGAHE